MNKQEKFKQLVDKRKAYHFSDGLLNPQEIENGRYDNECSLNPWDKWHGDLDASILVIGQDWGSKEDYIKQKGRDSIENKTCLNLALLFQEIGIDIGTPDKSYKDSKLFFTNLIMGIRDGKISSGNFNEQWVNNSFEDFVEPLIDIIQPKAIIAVGGEACKPFYKVIKNSSNRKKRTDFNDMFPNPHITEITNKITDMSDKYLRLPSGILLFPRVHCGGSSERNQLLEEQKTNWQKIAEVLKAEGITL